MEAIICAAIWYKELDKMSDKWGPAIEQYIRPSNINKGIVICGFRHPNCIYVMVAITGKRSVIPECGEYEQGFLTNKNRFVDRIEAAIIAKAANQVDSSKVSNYLFSEDLY